MSKVIHKKKWQYKVKKLDLEEVELLTVSMDEEGTLTKSAEAAREVATLASFEEPREESEKSGGFTDPSSIIEPNDEFLPVVSSRNDSSEVASLCVEAKALWNLCSWSQKEA